MRRSVKPAPKWFTMLIRFLVLAPFPVMLVLGPSVPRSIIGLPLKVVGMVSEAGCDEPVAGARVWVHGDPVRFETKTDEAGIFRLFLPALGSGEEPDPAWLDGYRIGVEAQGLLCEKDAFHLPHPIPDPFPIHLRAITLHPPAWELCGTVCGLDGRPVPGAGVSFEGRQTVADGDGRFGPMQVPASAGYRNISANAPGLTGTLTMLVFPGWAGTHEVVVPIGPSDEDGSDDRPVIEARLLSSDGTPAAGIRVKSHVDVAQTDAEGRFRVRTAHHRFCRLLCTEGIRFRGQIFIYLEEPERVFRLPALTRVRARVRDEITGWPLPDVVVTPFNVVTDEWGCFETLIPEDNLHWCNMTLRKAGYGSSSQSGFDADGNSEFHLTPLASVHLRVEDAEHRPVAGAEVVVSWGLGKCRTDEAGSARTWVHPHEGLTGWIHHAGETAELVPHGINLKNLVHGALAAVGILGPPPQDRWVIEPGECRDLGTFVLGPTPWTITSVPVATVKVVDPNGRPVPMPFTLERLTIPRIGDEHGELDPTGEVLTAEGFECVRITPELVKSGRIVLRPARPISGRLLTAEGDPVAGAKVLAKGVGDGSLIHSPRTVTDLLGRFVIYGVPEGERGEVIIRRRGNLQILGSVQGGAENVILKFTRD